MHLELNMMNNKTCRPSSLEIVAKTLIILSSSLIEVDNNREKGKINALKFPQGVKKIIENVTGNFRECIKKLKQAQPGQSCFCVHNAINIV